MPNRQKWQVSGPFVGRLPRNLRATKRWIVRRGPVEGPQSNAMEWTRSFGTSRSASSPGVRLSTNRLDTIRWISCKDDKRWWKSQVLCAGLFHSSNWTRNAASIPCRGKSTAQITPSAGRLLQFHLGTPKCWSCPTATITLPVSTSCPARITQRTVSFHKNWVYQLQDRFNAFPMPLMTASLWTLQLKSVSKTVSYRK